MLLYDIAEEVCLPFLLHVGTTLFTVMLIYCVQHIDSDYKISSILALLLNFCSCA